MHIIAVIVRKEILRLKINRFIASFTPTYHLSLPPGLLHPSGSAKYRQLITLLLLYILDSGFPSNPIEAAKKITSNCSSVKATIFRLIFNFTTFSKIYQIFLIFFCEILNYISKRNT